MKRFTKLLLALTLCVFGGVSSVKADVVKITLDQLSAGYGTNSEWLTIANGITYPIEVKDGTLFGSDGTSQTTNADVKDYDYLYVTVTNFTANKAVRIFFWDKAQNKRLDYYLKPVADKETANFEAQSNITGNGTYCVKVPDGARLQGAKPSWGSSSEVSFKFSEIYLTERSTPYVELVPYTLVYSEGKANIPISESHIRTTGNVSINYSTGVVTSTGSGKLIIYLNNENLIGATRYVANVTDDNETKLEPTLEVADADNGEVGGIYGSRYNWNIAGDAGRNTRIGAVTALRYNFSRTGSMTINSLDIYANELVAETTEKNLTDLPYGRWGLPANKVSNYIEADAFKTNNIDGVAHNDIMYGHDGNGDAYKYVDLTNCKKIIFTGFSANGVIRLFYNWSGTEADKPIEIINDFPTTSGTYVFDIEAFKKTKKLTFFHLNGIKSQWANVTLSSVKVVEYTNVISGSGIDRTKNYLSNPYITSIDATGLINTSAIELTSANPNCLFVAESGKLSNANNVIVSGTCASLVLTDGHPFKAPANFTATAASYSTAINDEAKAGTLCLPFAATIPEGVEAYTLTYTSGATVTAAKIDGTIPANTPVLLNGEGDVTFTGAGSVNAAATNAGGALTGVFEETAVPENSFVLQNGGSGLGFYKVTTSDIKANPFRAYLTAQAYTSRLAIVFADEEEEVTGIQTVKAASADKKIFNLNGQRMAQPKKGLNIIGGKKVLK